MREKRITSTLLCYGYHGAVVTAIHTASSELAKAFRTFLELGNSVLQRLKARHVALGAYTIVVTL